jgi:GH35 family endo-1,4-beta-xylanase
MKVEEMMRLYWNWTQPRFTNQIDRDIQQHRTDEFVFRVVDQNNNPVSHADIRVKMIKHEFGFGMQSLRFGLFRTEELNNRFAHWVDKTLNRTTVHTSWCWVEPKQKQYFFDKLDKSLEYAKQYDLETLGHCLFWDHNKWFRPQWIPPTMPHEDYMKLWYRYLNEMAMRYDNKIDKWHVINEATFKEDGNLTERIIVRNGFTRAFDYASKRLHGDLGLCFYQDAFETTHTQGLNAPEYKIVSELVLHNLNVGFIGLQFHVFDNRWTREPYEPDNIRRTLELFGMLAPIEIAEFGVYFGINLNDPTRRNYYNYPELQAVLIKNMMKFFFSTPQVRAVTYWQEFGKQAWNLNMIVDEDWNLLRSGQEFTHLITKEWMTDASGETDSDGVFSLRCFFGGYNIEVETKNNSFVFPVDCYKQSNREHTIVLNLL